MRKLVGEVWDEMNRDDSDLSREINVKTHEALNTVYEKRAAIQQPNDAHVGSTQWLTYSLHVVV